MRVEDGRTMRHTLSVLLTIACLAGYAAPIQAQMRPPAADLAKATLEDLMDIQITTATRGAEGAATAPARVQVVTADQVRRRGYRSLMDLLKDLPDFKVDLRGDQDYPTQISVQGSRGAERIVLLLDGIRVSSPTNEPLPILANYPVHAARQIEIVYGPASALYGADAFSAVINVISKEAGDRPALTVGTSFGQFGLFNQTGTFTTRVGRAGSLLVAAQAQYDRQPDLSTYYPDDFRGLQGQRTGIFNTIFGPMTSSDPVSPAYRIPLSAHSVQALLRGGGWQFMLFNSRSRVSTAPPDTPDNAIYDADAFYGNSLSVGSGSYTRRVAGVTSTSTLTYSRHRIDPESGYRNLFTNMDRSYKYGFASMLKGEEQLSWKPVPSVAATVGGTVERFFSIPTTADLTAPSSSHDLGGFILGTDIRDDLVRLHYTNAGAFGQVQYAPRDAVAFTVGGRADYNSRFGATFNPRAGLVLRPLTQTTVKLLAGRAYLAPSPFQTYSHYGSFTTADGGATYTSSYWHLGNPDLKPQRKSTLEMSAVQGLGSGLQVSASGFASRFTHLIKTADADRAYAGTYHGWPVDYIDFPVNQGTATLYGATFGTAFLHTFDDDRRIEVRAAVSLVDGREREDDPREPDADLPVGGIAPVQFRLAADVDWHRWSVAPRLTIEGRQRLFALDDGARRRTLPGYGTVEVNVRRRNVVKNIDVFLTLENAFDARYRTINPKAYLNPEELIGAPQNPRRVTIGFDVRLK